MRHSLSLPEHLASHADASLLTAQPYSQPTPTMLLVQGHGPAAPLTAHAEASPPSYVPPHLTAQPSPVMQPPLAHMPPQLSHGHGSTPLLPLLQPPLLTHGHGSAPVSHSQLTQHKQRQASPTHTTSGFEKVGHKLSETAGFAGNSIAHRVKGVARFFSKLELSKPPLLAWQEENEYASLFLPHEVEAAYYAFRALVTRTATPEDGTLPTMSLNEFECMFPLLDASILQRMWAVLFQRSAVDFEQYLRAMSNCLRRPRKCRLGLIYCILVGSRDDTLTMDHIEGVAMHLLQSLSFMGYGSSGSLRDLGETLWLPEDAMSNVTGDSVVNDNNNAPGTRGTDEFDEGIPDNSKRGPLSYGDFVRIGTALPEYHMLFDLFGLFSYLEHVVLGRLEQRPAQKEGFLKKSFGQRELKKTHWSCVRDGFFWYYNADDSAFTNPSRVLTLNGECHIEMLPGAESCPGFSIKQLGYQREFYCSTLDEARHWVACIQENVSKSEVPVERVGITCRWLVDGTAFFSEVRKAMLWAKREIFITGWFLSAHVLLKGVGDEAR
jgi:hypothetical protein